ncbi:MAG: hypothetical protein HY078_00520 [Elusimicrobia bacterium]|nr:hypothetical protein [Elusimicrobiota bacterium]
MGQIDPEKRHLLQAGASRDLSGRGPVAGYLYYHLNQPAFLGGRETLRLALAPGYLDAEVGIKSLLGRKTDVGFAIAGGAFADDYSEIRAGRYLRGESFSGDGARLGAAVYHDFPGLGKVPLAGIVRLEGHYASYRSNTDTEPGFETPRDQTEIVVRTGLRFGGIEPVMVPLLALELSVWQEGRYRLNPTDYGYGGDRRIEGDSQLFWTRAQFVYNPPGSKSRFMAGLTAGTTLRPDRFSAYRVGGDLPMASEFPLSLPGYYHQELSARNFALLGGRYIVPLSRDRVRWTAMLTGGTAFVSLSPGQLSGSRSHSGVGGGLSFLSKERSFQAILGYGYGINAVRDGHNGDHSIGILAQVDFRRAAAAIWPTRPEPSIEHILRSQQLRRELP